MLNVIPLKCASCGSNLEITAEMTSFACGYCGASQVVDRQGGTISLRLITDAISKVQVGTDKTAAELALKRLSGELNHAEQAYALMSKEKSRRLDSSLKVFGIVWIVGILFGLSFLFRGGLGAVIAVVLMAGGSVGAYYLLSKLNSKIKGEFALSEEQLSGQINYIRDKIAENRRYVDR